MLNKHRSLSVSINITCISIHAKNYTNLFMSRVFIYLFFFERFQLELLSELLFWKMNQNLLTNQNQALLQLEVIKINSFKIHSESLFWNQIEIQTYKYMQNYFKGKKITVSCRDRYRLRDKKKHEHFHETKKRTGGRRGNNCLICPLTVAALITQD